MTSSPSLSLPLQLPPLLCFTASAFQELNVPGPGQRGEQGWERRKEGGTKAPADFKLGEQYLQEVTADSGGHQHGDGHSAMEEDVRSGRMEALPPGGLAEVRERAPGASPFPV